MRFTHAAFTVGLVVVTSLPLAGTATAGGTVEAGRITATDYSAASPASVALDPATGSVTATFAQAAEDGVLSPKGSQVAYIQRRDTCVPQDEGCMYARDLVIAEADGSDRRVLADGVQPEDTTAPYVGRPDWSPSGKRIVYDSPRGLEWIATDGTGAEVLTSGSRGTFSPDGRSVSFLKATSYETPTGWEYGSDVYILDLATRGVRAVSTDHQAWSTPADWSRRAACRPLHRTRSAHHGRSDRRLHRAAVADASLRHPEPGLLPRRNPDRLHRRRRLHRHRRRLRRRRRRRREPPRAHRPSRDPHGLAGQVGPQGSGPGRPPGGRPPRRAYGRHQARRRPSAGLVQPACTVLLPLKSTC
ncbi:TolB family protein [Streptomyces sp. NBC_01794]|uniref:TolB family protein n=1 Tax=Streptomyces sp. NBC_01794 TaxID=2975942 RepID=UPI00308E47E7|nr:hypothetical protein OIE54_19325 [Streptomyces sp. NBC_01794]